MNARSSNGILRGVSNIEFIPHLISAPGRKSLTQILVVSDRVDRIRVGKNNVAQIGDSNVDVCMSCAIMRYGQEVTIGVIVFVLEAEGDCRICAVRSKCCGCDPAVDCLSRSAGDVSQKRAVAQVAVDFVDDEGDLGQV